MIENILRQNLVKYLVQRHMFCPISGDVLDVRTCVVILDSDGDPFEVISPRGYRNLRDLAERKGVAMLDEGYTFDENSLPKS